MNQPTTLRGEIQIILGPMYSGKTTQLLERLNKHTITERKCLVINHATDKRYGINSITTHSGRKLPAITESRLFDIDELTLSYASVVGIDEGQFFDDIVEFSENLANTGKTVIIAALDGDYKRECFGSIKYLIPKAESVIKLNSVCMKCHNKAAFTERLGPEADIQLVGGHEKYIATCRGCHKINTHTD